MSFDKRELILIAGILLFMVGLLPFTSPFYAIIISVLIYFGIKVFVGRRKKALLEKAKKGICGNCGSKLIGIKCPKCDGMENNT